MKRYWVQEEPRNGRLKQTYRVVTNIKATREGTTCTIIEDGLKTRDDAIKVASKLQRNMI